MAICRHCHRKMGMIRHFLRVSKTDWLELVFKIPEVKFLVVGTAASEYHLFHRYVSKLLIHAVQFLLVLFL